MKALRALAIVLGVVIIGGELFRSWGERAWAWWIDDILVGLALIATGALLTNETFARRALFAGAWGFSVGVIYISFFDKVVGPVLMGPGAAFNRLNVFVGLTLLVAIAGFVGSVTLPFKNTH
ncbi:MAG TPA: hypothetical protein VEA80_17150 [Vitreimonas sp.]|uniref:hypothetical protein n=1 Tax=Vitreimonas sp. TaxID=3069702 RepID=UPI002D294976|nr:hypothetical protein [Vitreimonas sp.]HYD89209.1 hypothetical protein [Vitreimonas sp.]